MVLVPLPTATHTPSVPLKSMAFPTVVNTLGVTAEHVAPAALVKMVFPAAESPTSMYLPFPYVMPQAWVMGQLAFVSTDHPPVPVVLLATELLFPPAPAPMRINSCNEL
jgi:hypothetical protein